MKNISIKESKQLSKLYLNKVYPLDQRKFLRLHTQHVVEIAKILGTYKKANLKTLEVAGWVHDIGYVANTEHHAIYTVGILKKKFNLDKELLDCILNHGNKGTPTTREGKIFQIADKLSILRPEIVKLILETTNGKTRKSDFDFLEMMTTKAIDLFRSY
jgi:HD superfamily phosphodiesterase